ncbi:DUF4232 domain-containing protein [Streptomyces sp. NBC_00354]|uniref:DUF4232 domain-containing protein n=1 Tax=Streptomyces sp. NBC_00354 TaxID=2975723 RepID=UPI003FA6B12F
MIVRATFVAESGRGASRKYLSVRQAAGLSESTSTSTGAAIVLVTNTSAQPCMLHGFPTVAGAGNGSPDRNRP